MTTDEARAYPIHGWWRMALFPVYTRGQGVFVVVALILPIVLLSLYEARLAVFVGTGAWIGFVLSMLRSTPSALRLRARHHGLVVNLLRGAGFSANEDESRWRSPAPALAQWKGEEIAIERSGDHIEIRGRKHDLDILAAEASASDLRATIG